MGAGRRVAALAAVVVLSAGCGQEAPGVAASVDGEQITMDQVDSYAGAVCTFNQVAAKLSGQPQQATGEELRGFAVDLLVLHELTGRVAEQQGVSVPAAAGAQGPDAQTEEVIAAMPAADGEIVNEIVSTSQRDAALRDAIGVEILAREGVEGNSPQAEQVVNEAFAREEAAADIDIDPRLADAYAARAEQRGGAASEQESPLSVPVSANTGEEAPSCS